MRTVSLNVIAGDEERGNWLIEEVTTFHYPQGEKTERYIFPEFYDTIGEAEDARRRYLEEATFTPPDWRDVEQARRIAERDRAQSANATDAGNNPAHYY